MNDDLFQLCIGKQTYFSNELFAQRKTKKTLQLLVFAAVFEGRGRLGLKKSANMHWYVLRFGLEDCKSYVDRERWGSGIPAASVPLFVAPAGTAGT